MHDQKNDSLRTTDRAATVSDRVLSVLNHWLEFIT